jgi:hypothetical protein
VPKCLATRSESVESATRSTVLFSSVPGTKRGPRGPLSFLRIVAADRHTPRVIGKGSPLALLLAVAVLSGGMASAPPVSSGSLLPTCAISQLRLELGPLVSEKTEQHTAAFVLTNRGSSLCALEGYPTLKLFDARDRLLSFAYGHRGDQMITNAPPANVRVRPGGSAYFELNKNACVGFSNRVARTIRVTLPGARGGLSLRLARYPIIDYCPPSDPGGGITLSPVEPTLAATGCRKRRACGPGVRRNALPPAGPIVGTLRVSLREGLLFAARGKSLFVITFPEQAAKSITIERLDPNGAVRRKHLPFPLAYYLRDLSTGRSGLYAGTAVIKRFTNVPDVLLRIDPTTLAVRARASFPARIAAVEAAKRLWASIGDGRVVRLDPTTLHVIASRRLLPSAAVAMRGLSLSKPAVGLGSLWVLAGDRRDLQLVRMNPTTLAVRSRTRLPLGAPLSAVIADADHVYLVGTAIASINAHGRLTAAPIAAPNLAAAAIYRAGLVGLNGGSPALELLTSHGRVTAQTALRDSSGELVVSGNDAWFLGNGGGGNGIVHVHLRSNP